MKNSEIRKIMDAVPDGYTAELTVSANGEVSITIIRKKERT